MSTSIDARDPIDLRAVLGQIDRDRAETLKFLAEQTKLAAEARKFDRERWLLLVGAFGGIAGMIAAGVTAAKALGWIP